MKVSIMSRILIVEDDRAMSDGIQLALRSDSYSFTQAFNLKAAREWLQSAKFDCILLDVNLPDGSGLSLLKEVRRASLAPVILLTANDLEIDIVSGLELGADDYITKPFSLMVLRARVNARLRNSTGSVPLVKIDDFTFNFGAMTYSRGNRAIELSKTEQRLLRLLVERRGHILSRENLIDWIWAEGTDYVDENALSVTIKRLRDKLGENPSGPEYIKTVYGIGYTWIVN